MTADQPRLRPGCEAFQVEELPAYEPIGDGEHRYLWVEKRDLTSDRAAQLLATACGRRPRDVGYAGRKDRHAVTRQWFSIHFGDAPDPERLTELLARHGSGTGLRVLIDTRHRNKLRTGHLRGNRFDLLIDGVQDPASLQQRLDRMREQGLSNGFGPQRFGTDGNNLTIARCLAQQDWHGAAARLIDPSGAWRPDQPLPAELPPGGQRRSWAALARHPQDHRGAWQALDRRVQGIIRSAAQSACFNAVLAGRTAAALLTDPLPGDWLQLPSGAGFRAEATDLAELRQRLASGACRTTGPLPGHEGLGGCGDQAAVREAEWLAEAGWDPAWFARGRPLAATGERRPLVVGLLEEPVLAATGDGHRLTIALPAGSYATEALRQLGIALPAQRGDGESPG